MVLGLQAQHSSADAFTGVSIMQYYTRLKYSSRLKDKGKG